MAGSTFLIERYFLLTQPCHGQCYPFICCWKGFLLNPCQANKWTGPCALFGTQVRAGVGWTRLCAAEPEGSGLFGPPLTEAAGRKPKSRRCSSMAVSSPGLGGSAWCNWLEVLFSFPALAAALRGAANCSAAWSRRCAHSQTISDDDSMSKCKARCYHVDTEIETLCWTLIQFDWRYASINSSCYHPPFPPPHTSFKRKGSWEICK